MGEPCNQAEKIGRIEATLIFFQDAERRREARELRAEVMLETREEKVAQILETIASQGASQGATIAAQGETLARFEKSFTEAFLRLRKLEGSTLISKMFTGKSGPYLFAVLITGFVYGLTRMDDGTLEKLIKVIKLITGG